MSCAEPTLLAPIGRAEPDDVQGWLEQGGLLALQQALVVPPPLLRQRLTGVERRDGTGRLTPRIGQPIQLTIGESGSPARFLIEEIPVWVIGGALVLALACETPTLTLPLPPDGAVRSLLQAVVQQMEQVALIGTGGWLRGIQVVLGVGPEPGEALDPVTAHLLTSVISQGSEPGSTLLFINHAPLPYEVPLGQSLVALLDLLNLLTTPTHLVLGEQPLTVADWQKPLTFDHFGRALGSGRLTFSYPQKEL